MKEKGTRIEFPLVTGLRLPGLEQVCLPEMVKIQQVFDDAKLERVDEILREQMEHAVKDKGIVKNKRICIAVGSRGISQLQKIVAVVCCQLKSWGALPFIVPAMGSHGGGTAEGQKEILEGYGITPEKTGAPVLSDMAVVRYGALANGTPLYCDRYAFTADWIVLINKEKPHTAFRGVHESGLAKMMVIGLGKHVGAAAFHRQGMSAFPSGIPAAARCFLETMPVLFGVGVVENAYDEICHIAVADAEHLMEMDAENLVMARERMARFKFSSADILVIDEIGKNISGQGHDPNVTGRAAVEDDSFREILDLKRMVILGISKESHHNGNGIADADVTTRRCVSEIDWAAVWTNVLTANVVGACKIPIYANSDREAIRMAAYTCTGSSWERLRIVRIRNTRELGVIEVSKAMYEELKGRDDIRYVKGPYVWQFDQNGNF